MRKLKSFKIEGNEKQFEVRELTVREIIELVQGGPEGEGGKSIMDSLKDSLLPICSNITIDELYDMAPSEIEVIFEKFKEVNRSFFDVARRAGLGTMVESYIKEATSKFSALPASLLKQDMEMP